METINNRTTMGETGQWEWKMVNMVYANVQHQFKDYQEKERGGPF